MGTKPAVLIGPAVDESEMLTEFEYELVKRALELSRSEKDVEAQAITYGIERCSKRWLESYSQMGGSTLTVFMHGLLQTLGDHAEAVQGMLATQHLDERMRLLGEGEEGEREVECLDGLLTLIRAGDWLGDFLKTEIPRIVQSGSCPTPIGFMQSLHTCAAKFESEIAIARRMLQGWPALISSEVTQ
jgi:hypothetical protein